MKNLRTNFRKFSILIFASFSFLSCSTQTEEFTLVGKWKEIEYHGSNGAELFVQKIDNGRIFIFENLNKIDIVTDKLRNVGSYQIKGDSLQISLPNEDNYYQLIHLKNGNIALSPRTEKYEITCDEGCSYIFKKLK
jgi:hypothetical protein